MVARRQAAAHTSDHDGFFKAMELSADRFATAASYIGSGMWEGVDMAEPEGYYCTSTVVTVHSVGGDLEYSCTTVRTVVHLYSTV